MVWRFIFGMQSGGLGELHQKWALTGILHSPGVPNPLKGAKAPSPPTDTVARQKSNAPLKPRLGSSYFLILDCDRIGQLASDRHAAKVVPVYAHTDVVVSICLDALP